MVIKKIKKFFNRRFFLWFACFLFLWLVFSLVSASFLDPDFGWHFRTGEWIWQNRTVPQKDLFSYTMPDYQWRYHSWLSEVFLYKAYLWWGYTGLAFFFGFLGSLAFMVAVPFTKINFAFIPLLLAGQACLGYMSVRPTMISYFLAAVVFLILRKSYRKPSKLFLLPFIFLIWANLHGAFSIGLAVMGFLILSDFYLIVRKKRKLQNHFLLTIFSSALSIIVVMVNPYGWRIYQEVFQTLFSSQLHGRIVEWLPYSDFNPGMFFYTGLFWALVFVLKEKVPFFEKVTGFLLLLAAFSSRRFLIYYFIFTLPEFIIMLKQTYLILLKQHGFLKIWRQKKIVLIVSLFAVGLAYYSSFGMVTNLKEDYFYPGKAVLFLQKHFFNGNLFSTYNWGGYLIWKMPEKKVYIDGRMAIWKDHGYSAFEEQQKIFSGKDDYQPVFDRYSVEVALLPTDQQARKSLASLLSEIFRVQPPVLSFSQRLLANGWQIVYKDGVSQVLVGPKTVEKFL